VKRTERLFAIAELLRARRTGITAEEIAERFGLSVRTVYRDLDALRDASLPLAAERGRGGGYALDRTYSLPPVNFTVREAIVLLVLGRLAADLRLLPFTRTMGTALDKVRAALPTAAQRQLEARQGTLAFTGVPGHASDPDVRAAVEEAWFEGTPVEVTYARTDHSTGTRTVRITQVVLERSETLLNTVDEETGEKRQLRLHRIVKATPVHPSSSSAPTPRNVPARGSKT
jgi:predicted DNA-binding transcriptional regulator YafY